MEMNDLFHFLLSLSAFKLAHIRQDLTHNRYGLCDKEENLFTFQKWKRDSSITD
jgi:hypothetical protein